MFQASYHPVKIVTLPDRATLARCPAYCLRSKTLPTMYYLGQGLHGSQFHQHMHMVWHHNVRMELVSLAVEMLYCTSHH